MFENKKVLVTGGAGFIGSNLVAELQRLGAQVIVVDNLSAGDKRRLPAGVEFQQLDIRDLASLKPAFVGVDYVFHLAALPRVQFSIENPIETSEVNVMGTLNVLEASRLAHVKRVVYSASSSAYGNQAVMPLVEEMTPAPLSPYGLQKLIGEEYCQVWNKVYDLPTVCLRYFNVYGPGQSAEGAYALVIAKFLLQKQNGQSLTITGDGGQTRDFTHVSDVVRANLAAATSSLVGQGEVINIGAGNNQSIKRIAELIGGQIEYVPARLEPKNTLADIRKAKKLLAWEPQVSIEQGINELKDLSEAESRG